MANIHKSPKIKELEAKYAKKQQEYEEIRELIQCVDQLVTGDGIGLQENLKTIEELIGEIELEKDIAGKNKGVSNGKALIISVDCERNDVESVVAGGPEHLGYDFIVQETDVEEMRHKIALLIKKNNQPLIRTYVRYDEKLRTEHSWSFKKIQSCIEKGYK